MFAGAAVATTITTSADKISHLAALLACCSATTFAIGGAAGCVGLYSAKSVFAGEPPSWWAKSGLEKLADLKSDEADYWLAGHYEAAIHSLAKAVARRAISFNVALGLGVLAGALIAIAAWTAPTKPAPAQPPAGTQSQSSPHAAVASPASKSNASARPASAAPSPSAVPPSGKAAVDPPQKPD
jgi:hypothetical protein